VAYAYEISHRMEKSLLSQRELYLMGAISSKKNPKVCIYFDGNVKIKKKNVFKW
jgi:hypothetical protein